MALQKAGAEKRAASRETAGVGNRVKYVFKSVLALTEVLILTSFILTLYNNFFCKSVPK